MSATRLDIVDNPYNIEIVEIEAAQIPRTLQDVNFGVMNGNYAMEAGYTVSENALLVESAESDATTTYVNVIAVKEGNEKTDRTAMDAPSMSARSEDFPGYSPKGS